MEAMIRLLSLTSLLVCALGAIAPAPKQLPVGRIVGGEVADINDTPWQVSVLHKGSHVCSGALIGTTCFLTTASCVQNMKVADMLIRVNSSELYKGGQVQGVSKLVLHPFFNSETMDYDLALLRLNDSVKIGKGVDVVFLIREEDPVADGALAQVSGWGSTTAGSANLTEVLQQVTVPIVNQAQCNLAYNGKVTASMICAGAAQGGKAPCNGDAGAPLTVGGVLVGLYSWSTGCGTPGVPGVYSRLSLMHMWIEWAWYWG